MFGALGLHNTLWR